MDSEADFQLDEVISTLLNDPKGQILGVNLIHSIQRSILSENVASNFLKCWFKRFMSGAITLDFNSLKKEFDVVTTFLEGAEPGVLQSTLVHRKSTNDGVDSFYTVKSFDTLYKYILKGDCSHDVLPDPSLLGFDESARESSKYGMLSQRIAIPISSNISYLHNVFWVSTDAAINKIKEEEEFQNGNPATRTRDLLGLALIDSETSLVAIGIEKENFYSTKHDFLPVRPTPIDAGFYPRFKCLAEFEMEGTNLSESGFTYDLKSNSDLSCSSDGAPEFIVKESDIKKIEEVDITYLGYTKTSVDLGRQSDERFIEYLLAFSDFPKPKLKNKLKEIYHYGTKY